MNSSNGNGVLFSLLIATCGRKEPLVRLLDSLCEQTEQNFEVLVGDQNPSGILDEILGQYRERLAIIPLPVAVKAASQARNALIPKARGTFIAFPDDDCLYAPDTLEKVRQVFLRAPQAGGLLARWCPLEDLKSGSFPAHSRLPGPISRYAAFRHSETWRMFYRRQAVAAVDGFDPALGPGEHTAFAAADDTDFLLRIMDRGFKIIRPAEVRVYHPPVKYGDPLLPDKNKAYCAARMHLLRKHSMPFWFTAGNIAYPLLVLPFEGPKAWNYRWDMFRWRLSYFFQERPPEASRRLGT